MAFNGVNENDVQVPQQKELIDYLNFLPSDGEIYVSSLKTMKAIKQSKDPIKDMSENGDGNDDEVIVEGFMSSYFDLSNNVKAYTAIVTNGFIPETFFPDETDITKDTKGGPMGINNPFSKNSYIGNIGMGNMSEQTKMQSLFYGELLMIFTALNLVVIFLFVKRRIDEDRKNISTLKSLGYRSSKIAFTFAILPMMIGFIGGGLGLAAGMGVQAI
jgi:ABC-type antimicrobial peptide transport system permease subunit